VARGEARLCWAVRSKSSPVWICPPLCFRQKNSRIDPAGQISSQSQASAFRLRFDAAIQAAQDVRRGAADSRNASSEVASVSGPARAPPGNLVCPISFNMFRDPVMVVESGHTYDRNEITQHFAHNNRDPKTNLPLRSTRVVTNWGVRDAVQEWLDRHPDVTPDGWDSRELLPVQVEAPVQTAEAGHGDALVLQMWRDMCPELQAIWEVDRPVEQWRGVTMLDGRVVRLQLSGVSLSQVVPACIGRLTALQVLNLANNRLTSVPAEIGQLAALQLLDLRGNQLSSLPAEIGQLPSLRELNLDDNKLTSLPAEIWQLTSLRGLDLGRNQLTSLPVELGQLTALEVLSLSRNQLTSVPAEVWQLTSLKRLWLRSNQLTSMPAELGRLTALRQLWHNNNKLTSLPAEVGQLTSLRALELANNQLTSLPAEIWQLTSLRGLDLGRNQLTSLPAEVGRLSALKRLNLGGNRLTSLPAEIGQLTSLRDLSLSGNQLTSVPADIGRLTSLEKLYLEEHRLRTLPAAIGELAVRGCEVFLMKADE